MMRRAARYAVRRRLGRALWWVVAPVVALVGFRLFWGWHAQGRLEGSLARLKAMHVRLTPEEWPDDQAVPAGENAVEVLLGGPVGFGETTAESDLIINPFEHQTAAEKEALLKLLAVHQDIVDRIDAAGARRMAVWPREILRTGTIPSSRGAVDFSRLLLKAARIAHERHDDVTALLDLNRLLIEARVYEHGDLLIHHLLAAVLRDIAIQGLEAMHSDLAVQDPAVAAEATRLLAAVLDDGRVLSGMGTGLEAEVTMENALSDGFTRLGLAGESYDFGWVLRPLAMEDWARGLDQKGSLIEAFRAPDLPRFVALSSRIPAPPRYYDEMTALLSLGSLSAASLVPRYENTLTIATRGRAVGVLLAAKLYATERGAPPTQLEDMKGMLGGKLPVDLYVEGDQPLHYRLDAGGPTVWGVGRNGVDDHGDTKKDMVYGAANPPAAAPPPRPPATRRGGASRPVLPGTMRGVAGRSTAAPGG
jgi:hypothetical protein